MLQVITIAQYYASYSHLPLVDVRSPGEYDKGHIPQARNIALFSNDERAIVGTAYVQESRDKAIELGYQFVTPKLQAFIDDSAAIAPDAEIVVHCWRGGMRSKAFAQHLHENGFKKVYTIKGGYKAFRNHALKFFNEPFKLFILGGFTGSGKTHILHEMAKKGEQIIDLEYLAHHKGSAFGAINEPQQPTVEQFENNLFEQLRHLNLSKNIWVEDESHGIGKVQIPMAFFNQMRETKVLFIDIPREERAKLLVEEYSHDPVELLFEAVNKIHKRLGGLRTQQALTALSENNFYDVALITLFYYDKAYKKGISSRNPETVMQLELQNIDAVTNAKTILEFIKNHERN